VNFKQVRLRAPAHLLADLREFYDRIDTGETKLEFAAGEGEPFYHFALLAPPERFDELVSSRPDLLPDPETGEVVFDFDFWEAKAFYFHDPAGNIVELVAHRGLEDPTGLSELGLVGDKRAMAAELQKLGIELWDGTLEDGRLAFMGQRGRTLILAPPGRGWMPTGRPSERHPVEVELSGPPAGAVELEGGLYRIARR
jgi:catechol 2,3-dioxygenase-like lactoylglutathione lyase family enzyme